MNSVANSGFGRAATIFWPSIQTASAVTAFVVGYEQPTLRERYDAYRDSGPAVVPRLRRHAGRT